MKIMKRISEQDWTQKTLSTIASDLNEDRKKKKSRKK
jgi:hypothetical protein